MITIGPWWLYDFILFLIIFSITVRSIRNGFWVGLYFFLSGLAIYLLLTFLPQVIANALSPQVVSLFKSWGAYQQLQDKLGSASDTLNSMIQNVFDSFGKTGSFGSFDVTGLVDEGAVAMIALFLYLLVFVVMWIVLVLIVTIVYACIKERLKSAKINRYVSALLGCVFGVFIGLFVVSAASQILALPLLDYSSQKIGPYKLDDENQDMSDFLADRMKNGNQYVHYGVTANFVNLIPAGTLTFSYTESCMNKYVLTPIFGLILAGFKIMTGDESTEKLDNIFGSMQDAIVEGYTTTNVLKLPVKSCVEVLPVELQNFTRFIVETVLVSSIASHIGTSNDPNNERGQAGYMFEQMDIYKVEHNLADNYRFDEKGFVDFYNWSDTQERGNQFKKSATYIAGQANLLGTGWTAAQNILNDPHKMYNFMKNTYDLNYRTANASSIPPLPSIFSSLYLMPGLELVPGGVFSALFGETQNSSGGIDLDFELQHYMGYIDVQ